jgi:hypothetical protein
MYFGKNKKTLINKGISNVYKGFLNGGEGEIRTLYNSFVYKGFQDFDLFLTAKPLKYG